MPFLLFSSSARPLLGNQKRTIQGHGPLAHWPSFKAPNEHEFLAAIRSGVATVEKRSDSNVY